MLILQAKELESQGYLYKSSTSRLVFQGKEFQEVACFPKARRQVGIESCQELLAQGIDCILVENLFYFTVWKQTPAVSGQISPPSDTQALPDRSNAPQHNPSEQKLESVVKPKAQSTPYNQTVTKSAAAVPALPIEFIKQCERELTRCIGPMASLILEEVLAQSIQIEPRELVEILANEIPDPQKAQKFRQHFL